MSDINDSNENYIKEMEKNARIFQEKMNKFEQMHSSNLTIKENNQNLYQKQINKNNNFHENNAYNNKRNFKESISSQYYIKNKTNDDNRDDYYERNNNIRLKNNKSEVQNNLDKNELIKCKHKIEQLKNEIFDKNKIIKALEKSLKEKENLPTEKQYEEITIECEKLKLENNEKIKYIKAKEAENKELKMKIDNLVEQIKNMKDAIKRKNDDIENLNMNIESLKEEIMITNKKMSNLELQNKKLNIEYEKLNKDFSIIKNEKEKMSHELEEQKANIFNFQKELSKNKAIKNAKSNNNNFDYDGYNYSNINNKIYENKQDYQEDNIDMPTYEKNYNDKIFSKKNQNEFSNEDIYKNENSKISKYEEKSKITNKTEGIKKRNFYNYDLEHFGSYKKPLNSLSELESRLSYLISEKKKLENELLKMPEHPRNLNEIKIKKELNNKISDTEQEINSIRYNIRNFNY